MTQRDPAVQAKLDQLLSDNGLDADSPLFREAMREALGAATAPGVYRISANPTPSESVVDIYGSGHLVQAEQVGQGLAFIESALPSWQETMELRALRSTPDARKGIDKVEVAVRLGDVLAQGGLVYPVESVTVEKAWYCTLPAGSIEAHVVHPA
jgi:hypothetical protein